MNNKAIGALGGLCLAGVPAKAATFALSECCGTGPVGTMTGADLGAQAGSTDTVRITIQMAPNFILDTGSHFAATFSLAGTGRVDGTNLDTLNGGSPPNFFDTNTHQTVLANEYSNSPFGKFRDAITGHCGSGASSGGCGSLLVFDIINFQGILAATNLFDQPPAGGPTVSVYAAVDIYNQSTGYTGAVGLTAVPEITVLENPPGGTPIPGAVWLFGTVLAGGAGYGRWRKKRKAQVAA